MPLSINTNIASMTAQRSFLTSNSALETSFERLSTGKRVNSAVDDAAGLAIGKDLEARVSGLNQAIRNVNDGISMVQIVEGTLDEATTIVQRMRDLAVQANNGSLSSTEQQYLDDEMDKLQISLDAVVNQATFNGTDLLDGTGKTFTIQSGANAGETTTITTDAMSSTVLEILDADIDLTGSTARADVLQADTSAMTFNTTTPTITVDGTVFTATGASGGEETAVDDLTFQDADGNTIAASLVGVDGATMTITFTGVGQHSTVSISDGTNSATFSTESTSGIDNASTAITTLDRVLATIASDRAALGATQSQLESTVRNLSNVAENTAAAAGRIMDTDYAAETANLTKAQILQQAATSVLAQANAQPQAVLSLLQ
ncbi:MAG TPA: flagellin [Halieaceae bacterium]|nr:flagellin [Halieaceae bacterium]